MTQCKYVDLSKTPQVPCGYLASPESKFGYCPRHELLVPALEARAREKEASMRVVIARKRRERVRHGR